MASSSALPVERHPAHLVPYQERREQVRLVSTLPADQLQWQVTHDLLGEVLSAAAQGRLVHSPRVRVRKALALHEHLLPEHQLVLAVDGNQYVRRNLAQNPALVPDAAELLHDGVGGERPANAHPYIVVNLAFNRATPLRLLRTIREEHSRPGNMVHLYLLVNPTFPLVELGPVEVLDRSQQFQLSKRPGISPEEFRSLRASDVSPFYLERFAPEWWDVVTNVREASGCTVGELLDALEHRVRPLPPAAREAFDLLQSEWNGTLEELVSTCAILIGSEQHA